MFISNGNTWAEQQELSAPVSSGITQFGQSVGVSGDTAIIGAVTAAFIFTRQGVTWTQQQQLADPNPQVDYNVYQSQYGKGVALSGNTALIAANGNEVIPGVVYTALAVGDVSVSPINGGGSGGPDVFSAKYNTNSSNLEEFYVDFGTGSPMSGAGCVIIYQPAGTYLTLLNDNNLSAGSINPGTGESVSNSQCTLSSDGPVTNGGGKLTVPFTLKFAPGFFGRRSVWTWAKNYDGADNGWQSQGTWITGPGGISVSPINGSGFRATFEAQYIDAKGASDLGMVFLDFGSAPFATESCIVAYEPATTILYLAPDDNSPGWYPVRPGDSNSAVSNNQCTLSGFGPLRA